MSRLSIFQTQWIDLVFEDRNKNYGAYQLRRESGQTGFKAISIAVLFVLSAYTVFLVGNLFMPRVIELTPAIQTTVIEVSNIRIQPEPEKPKQNNPTAAAPVVAEPNKQNMSRPNVLDQQLATAALPQNTDIATVSTAGTSPTGTDIPIGAESSGTTNEPTLAIKDFGNTIVSSAELDKNPEFPGGIKVFLNYVATNFKPAEELENTVKANVSFVVEKDGSMSNIQVRNNPDYGMGEEAIRVLKSMKTKWQPGKKDGQNVRAYYNLPITIQM
jgi:protein TonB